MPIAAATPMALGSDRRTSTPNTRPTANSEDLTGPPPGECAAPLAWAEPVARPALVAHPPSPGPGGQAGGSHLMQGPWPSLAM